MTAPLVNARRAARCCYCGRICPPGEAHVWRCPGPEHCAAPHAVTRGWHAICLDRTACRRRVQRAADHRARRARALRGMRAPGEQLAMEV